MEVSFFFQNSDEPSVTALQQTAPFGRWLRESHLVVMMRWCRSWRNGHWPPKGRSNIPGRSSGHEGHHQKHLLPRMCAQHVTHCSPPRSLQSILLNCRTEPSSSKSGISSCRCRARVSRRLCLRRSPGGSVFRACCLQEVIVLTQFLESMRKEVRI